MASIDSLSTLISIAAILVSSSILALLSVKLLSTSKLQGKKYHPVGGTIFHQLFHFNKLHHFMTDRASKYKTYRLLSPFRNEIYTTDPANVEHMLKTNFDNYGKGLHNYRILGDLLGDGIFTVDGEKWRQQRKVSSYEFSTKVLRDFSSIVFQKNVAKLAKIISEAAASNQIMDIQDLFMKSTLDSIFKVAFGVELDSMCGSSEEGTKFSNAFDDSSAMTLRRYVDVFWSIKKALNMGVEAELKKNIKVIDDFVYKLIRSKEKVAQEIKDATNIKEGTDVDEFAACIRDEALEKMQYLHASLTETLRLYPAVPVDAKICFSDDTWPDGFSVRKGDMVAYQPYAMGRMKFIWGDDAEEFRPERWLDQNGIFQPESPFKFTAFQAGPRICLGKEFAYRQMKIFSAVLLGFFVFKLGDDKKAVNYRTMINLHIDGGLHVRAFCRLGG
ncbi:hypothetical protein RHGRI_019185 [Rhododendron griersonianum]|uniref:Uncharacterized protein n=1 Tax=Rhododendron griersonianum TaxID=479676 RepID=A0AAV6JGD1_9ERIC|nr:hypothetical protein RHGRI_019185 [Rhododendron griersonianum]